MRIEFTKMHGLGNDFMVVEWPVGRPPPAPDTVRLWGDRRRGIGFDSLLLIENRSRYRVFNADGGEAGQCGNGARCIAAYLADGSGTEFVLDSRAGPIATRVLDAGKLETGEPYAIAYERVERTTNVFLRLVTVAEGVEDAETLKMVEALGIDCAQGFYIGVPQPFDWLEAAPRSGPSTTW